MDVFAFIFVMVFGTKTHAKNLEVVCLFSAGFTRRYQDFAPLGLDLIEACGAFRHVVD